MRYLTLNICLLIFSQTLLAAECEIERWQASLDELSSLSASEEVKEVVLADLSEWGPGSTNSSMRFPLWFLDAYMEDETLRRTVGAYFFPAFMQNCYEHFTGHSLKCPLDAMAHASELGIEALRLAKRMPYLLFSEYRTPMLANTTWRDGAKFCTSMLCHWSTMTSYLCTEFNGAYVGDPIGYAASFVTGEVFRIAGIVFAGATAYLAMEGEFIDLALRSLKRKYEMQNRYEEVAVVSMMMAYRRK